MKTDMKASKNRNETQQEETKTEFKTVQEGVKAVQNWLKTQIEEIKASPKITDRIHRVTEELTITQNTVEGKVYQVEEKVEHVEEKVEHVEEGIYHVEG